MNLFYNDWAAVIPMANESEDFAPFLALLVPLLDRLGSGKVYFVVDHASKDNTRELCEAQSARDPRFATVWAPANRNVVDAYLAGFRAAHAAGHELIIEMDAGLSHDPRAVPMFLRVLNEGNECAFGSRFCNGGSMADSPLKRRLLSRAGTLLANTLLGTDLYDMTSGFQGFHRDVIKLLLDYPLRSRAHFYQTELRYLLRHHRFAEVPIHYRAPSNRVPRGAVKNALQTLGYYFGKRLSGRAVAL